MSVSIFYVKSLIAHHHVYLHHIKSTFRWQCQRSGTVTSTAWPLLAEPSRWQSFTHFLMLFPLSLSLKRCSSSLSLSWYLFHRHFPGSFFTFTFQVLFLTVGLALFASAIPEIIELLGQRSKYGGAFKNERGWELNSVLFQIPKKITAQASHRRLRPHHVRVSHLLPQGLPSPRSREGAEKSLCIFRNNTNLSNCRRSNTPPF